MSDDPWKDVIPANYKPGMMIMGRITRVHRLGASVELEPGLEGVASLAEVSEPLAVGHEVEVRVLRVETDDKQIYCSICRI